jgi:hypothetical protein
MIKQLNNCGFKDQMRTVQFSGLDLITSNDVNGVGKSAVLEAFKLALTGEVPGRAKNVEDILEFTSLDAMNVEILADIGQRSVVVERRFLRHAPRGEKRPIWIDQVPRKYEEGSEWIRQHIGAVSLSFDPFEFLNLSDSKKRRWIIAHSPESLEFSRRGFYLLLLARMVEKYLGSGIVHSLLLSLGVASSDEIIGVEDKACLSSLQDRLIEVFHRQEPERSELTSKTLENAFRFWSPPESSEQNSNSMFAHLKSEALRLKNVLRQQDAALSCMSPASDKGVEEHSRNILCCREEIQSLQGKIADGKIRLRQMRIGSEQKITREERIDFLEQNISRLTDKLNGAMGKALAEMLDQLRHKRVDTEELEEKRIRLDPQLTLGSQDLKEQKLALDRLASELKLKRDKQDNLGLSHFTCPVARQIRCETDMNPYREILGHEIDALTRQEVDVKESVARATQKIQSTRQQIDALDVQLAEQLRANRETQREIDLLEEQIQAEEKEIAEAQGMLRAYREEWALLKSEPVREIAHTGDMEILKDETSVLKSRKDELQNQLDEFLRQEGKVEALSELKCKQQQWEQELEIVRQVMELISGIQEEMASRIAGALEKEVNDTLKLIDSRYDFIFNLRGRHFEMGWNRDGKVIPFQTMNSAHFILFIVPFLAALIKRLADVREKSGLPTLKALCIEAESLTPENLTALLKGLAGMKANGSLDNVLVAHYHSLGDPEKLCGFREHILEETESPVLA